MRRQQLTETQIAALFEPPRERRDLVRYYTLTETDLAMVRRCRGDHSRLGYALMLCYLRHPGRPLRTNERPPTALVSFVAEQVDVQPEAIVTISPPSKIAAGMPENCRIGCGSAPSENTPRPNSPRPGCPSCRNPPRQDLSASGGPGM